MPSVGEMKSDERKDLVKKIAQVVKDQGLDGKVKVKITRETVAALAADKVEDKLELAVSGEVAPDLKEKVDAFNEAVKPMIEGIQDAQVSVGVVLGAGCTYETIKNVMPIKGEEAVNLEHKEGEVWLIDFWATWCPPCQTPMAHNEEMLKKRGAEWGENVKIICISIDETKDEVVEHCTKKDWLRPIHYHRDKSDCSQQYKVRGVPNVMLIDTKGKIVFKGHPASRPNLEEDFDKLLKGEKLYGTGCEFESEEAERSAAGGDKAVEGETADAKTEESNVNPEDALAAIDTFHKETGPALQAKLKDTAAKMMRAFCVMTYEEEYDISTDKSKVDWKNYRVLVGPQASIDECKKEIEENIKGDFEVILREQAI